MLALLMSLAVTAAAADAVDEPGPSAEKLQTYVDSRRETDAEFIEEVDV